MNVYSISTGTPEGIDFAITVQHADLFLMEEFQNICEAAIVETLNRQWKTEEFVAISCIDTRLLLSVLKEKGFVPFEFTMSYHLEPHWGKDHIKNKELLGWLESRDKDDRVSCQHPDVEGDGDDWVCLHCGFKGHGD